MKQTVNKAHLNFKGSSMGSLRVDSDESILREQRNITRVHNPHLRPGQRANHHGFFPPAKTWTSRLEQAMAEYSKKATKKK
jgi:hypothetical protein